MSKPFLAYWFLLISEALAFTSTSSLCPLFNSPVGELLLLESFLKFPESLHFLQTFNSGEFYTFDPLSRVQIPRFLLEIRIVVRSSHHVSDPLQLFDLAFELNLKLLAHRLCWSIDELLFKSFERHDALQAFRHKKVPPPYT